MRKAHLPFCVCLKKKNRAVAGQGSFNYAAVAARYRAVEVETYR